MSRKFFSLRWCLMVVLLLAEFVLSAPQGYNYYSNQQRIYAQRAQAQRLQAQRFQAQNRYQQSYTAPRNTNKRTISRADSENAKFLGVQNQETDDNARTLNLIRRKKQFLSGNPCYFRNAGDRAEGRFLWDVNVYNIYSNGGGGNGCGNYSPRPFGGFFQNFLSLFVPGGALYAAPPRPYQTPIQSDSTGGTGGLPAGVQNDASIDPNLDSTGTGGSTGSVGTTIPVRAGAGGAPPLTLGQLVAGTATTVNGVIQQLTGNVQPVYRRYG